MLFALLVVAGLGYWRYTAGNRIGADTLIQDRIISGDRNITVEVTSAGGYVIDGIKNSQKVTVGEKFDEVRLKVLEEPKTHYDSVSITLKLPGEVADQTNPKILAIHGVGESSAKVIDSTTVLYQAFDVSPLAVISIVAEIPKGTIHPPLLQRLSIYFSGSRSNIWLAVGILFPILTTLLMLVFILWQTREKHVDIPDQEITAPPMALPPAIVGVLIHQKVRAREIAATLIDLAVRGDILILDRERGFAFGKGKFDQRLLGYEKVLLSKIFMENMSADRVEIEKRINNHFYSKKISLVSAGIYALTTRLGYFKVNPRQANSRYKLMGIFFFLIGIAGFILSLLLVKNTPYVVFFWLGMMISSLIIAFSAGNIPMRTPVGQETLSNWLAFKKFLSNPEVIPYHPYLEQVFERYLPYAIAFDCEAAWAKRFSAHNFSAPKWFLSEKSSLGLEDFCLSLFPIISYVSRSLVALREPGFE